MGIVVTIAMLLGLVVLRPNLLRNDDVASTDLRFITFVACYLLISGLWNSLWHGLRHLGEFWGIAAFVSGVVMVMSAIIILLERGYPAGISQVWFRPIIVWALAACFLLYTVTLIQLNLGYPIIGST